jgi:Cellulose or protein binding domain
MASALSLQQRRQKCCGATPQATPSPHAKVLVSMTFNWRKYASVLPLGSALLMPACSGTIDDPSTAADDSASSSAEYADENGVILGMSWQALSYPTCASAASDPDGDGWGWEQNKSCVVNKAASPTGGASKSICSNLEGTSSTMAGLAVAAATELGRWQPSRDFAIGKQGSEDILILSAEGKARCADHVCANTQALLDFQKSEANGKVKFPGNVSLNSSALRSRLVAKFREQVTCEQQPSNGGASNCPVEEHTLTFQRSEKGGCDTNFFFVARTPDGKALQFPAQLKNKLLWADRTNPYIGFQSVGEVVSIDPTFGLNERGTTATGACSAACVRIGGEDTEGDCCSCAGITKSFTQSAWNTRTFICQ